MTCRYVTTREVTQAECWWLTATLPVGSVIYRCTRPTYGAVRDFPATLDPNGDYPFFELPHDAIQVVLTDDDPRYVCISCRRVVDPEDEPGAGQPLRCPDCHRDMVREQS